MAAGRKKWRASRGGVSPIRRSPLYIMEPPLPSGVNFQPYLIFTEMFAIVRGGNGSGPRLEDEETGDGKDNGMHPEQGSEYDEECRPNFAHYC